MKVPFYYGRKSFDARYDGEATVSMLIDSMALEGNLVITGSQPGDYTGATMLFNVCMPVALAEKFFGQATVLSAELYKPGGINVIDKDHIIAWAREHGINNMTELQSAYPKYKHQFPENCPCMLNRVRISV